MILYYLLYQPNYAYLVDFNVHEVVFAFPSENYTSRSFGVESNTICLGPFCQVTRY